jgi:serralysin
MSVNENHYCVCLTEGNLSEDDKKRLAGHKAALLRGTKWDIGENITISFLEGAPELRERVKNVALEWTRFANLNFDFVNHSRGNIRIAFEQGDGSWSYLGTMCRNRPKSQPTMNYGWLTPDSSEDELQRVVLHEFGHAIGLIHEHQNPKGGIRWNKPAVIRDLSGPPNNWPLEYIEHNMFKKYSPTEVVVTDVDPTSIMMYPIPKSWTENGYFSADLNGELSAKDKAFIAENYPM